MNSSERLNTGLKALPNKISSFARKRLGGFIRIKRQLVEITGAADYSEELDSLKATAQQFLEKVV
ncbi:MAG: hypothetical protein ACNA7G_08230 [Methylobacter sp.]